jgi:hypothetical protein
MPPTPQPQKSEPEDFLEIGGSPVPGLPYATSCAGIQAKVASLDHRMGTSGGIAQ